MKKNHLLLCVFCMLITSSTHPFLKKQIGSLYASISLRYIAKAPLKLIKKTVLERTEPFYCASAYLIADKLIIPKQTYLVIPALGICKAVAHYVVIAWVFYSCFIGDSLDEINSKLDDIKTDTGSTHDIVQKLENMVKNINKNIALNNEEIKQVKDLIDLMQKQIQGIESLCNETNNNTQKILEEGSKTADLKNIENNLELKMNENTNKIIEYLKQKSFCNHEHKQQLANTCKVAITLAKMVLELTAKKIK